MLFAYVVISNETNTVVQCVGHHLVKFKKFRLKGISKYYLMSEISEYEIEEIQKRTIKTNEDDLCASFTRYCKGFTPSIYNLNEVISTEDSITIIIEKRYCKNNEEQRVTIEKVEDEPILMFDVLMHLMKHHKHKPHCFMYWEGLTDYKLNKKNDITKRGISDYVGQLNT